MHTNKTNYHYLVINLLKDLLYLAGKLAERIHKGKCIYCKSYLEYVNVPDGLLLFNSLDCNKDYEIEFNKNLARKFENTYRFCDKEINKFCLMLRKGVYPCIWIVFSY